MYPLAVGRRAHTLARRAWMETFDASVEAAQPEQNQLGPVELDQVQDYLRLHRAALRFEPGLVQEPGQLLALLDISPPAVRGLLVNALRCAGRLDLANRYDVERRIDASPSSSAATATSMASVTRRRGQFCLSVEVSAIQVCPTDFGLLAAAPPPVASTTERPTCWISVEALNRSVDDLVSLAAAPIGNDSRATADDSDRRRGPSLGCFGCCGRVFRFPFRRRPKRPPQAQSTPYANVSKKLKRQYQPQSDNPHDSFADGGGCDGLLVRKARLLAEKSAELYQAVLADSDQRLLRYLEQDCGLLCLEAVADPYCGLQLQLAATTAACLRRFLAGLSSGAVARRLEQLLLTDPLLAVLRLRRCRLQCGAPNCDLALTELGG